MVVDKRNELVLKAGNAYVMSNLFDRKWPSERGPMSWHYYYKVMCERLQEGKKANECN